jgi:hypothetical protein
MSDVELDPSAVEDLTRLRLKPNPTAEESIGRVAMGWIADAVIGSMVDGGFNPETISDRLEDSLRERLDALADTALAGERWRRYDEPVVHIAFGLDRVEEDPPGTVSNQTVETTPSHPPIELPEDFASAIVGAAGDIGVDFEGVDKIYRGFESTRIMDLVREVHAFISGTDQANSDISADTVFEKVRDSVFNPGYTVEDYEDLYMLCLIPPHCRQLIKHAVISTHVKQHMDKELEGGEDLSEGEISMRDSLFGVMKAEALTGQYWNDLAKKYGLSEGTTMEMMELGAEVFGYIAKINELLDKGSADRIMTAYQNAKEELYSKVKNASKIENISAISSGDIGHTFEGFDSWTIACLLRDRQREIIYGEKPTEPAKSGQHAVVFEDDRRQVDLWAGVINKHFHHTVSNEDVHELPEAVVERAEDPSASLFLLDVQVNNNQTAGIELAQRVVKIRMNMLERADDPDEIPETKIIVWSSSTESLSLARERLKNQLANARVRVSKKGIDSSDSSTIIGGARITVEVRPKQNGLTRYDMRR